MCQTIWRVCLVPFSASSWVNPDKCEKQLAYADSNLPQKGDYSNRLPPPVSDEN